MMNDEDHDDLPRKRARNQISDRATAREWYPWQDRIVSSFFDSYPGISF